MAKVSGKVIRSIIRESLVKNRVIVEWGPNTREGWTSHPDAQKRLLQIAKYLKVNSTAADEPDYVGDVASALKSRIGRARFKGNYGRYQNKERWQQHLKDMATPTKSAGGYDDYIMGSLTYATAAVGWQKAPGSMTSSVKSEFASMLNQNYTPVEFQPEVDPDDIQNPKMGDKCKAGEIYIKDQDKCIPETRPPAEVQRDPNKPVPMNLSQAKKFASERGAPHEALPDGDPDKRDSKSIGWDLSGRGLRPDLLALADTLEDAATKARQYGIRRVRSPQLYKNFMIQLGLNPQDPRFNSWRRIWEEALAPSMERVLGNIKILVFPEVLRAFAKGEAEGQMKMFFKQHSDGRLIPCYKRADDGSWEDIDSDGDGINDCSLMGSREGVRVYSSVPSTNYSDMIEKMKSKVGAIDSGMMKFRDKLGPKGVTGITAANIMMNIPKIAKAVIVGEDTPESAGSWVYNTLIHEIDHFIYGMLYGVESMQSFDKDEGHGFEHFMADNFGNLVQGLHRGKAAIQNFRDLGMVLHLDLMDFTDQAIADRRLKRAFSFIDSRFFSSGGDAKYAYESLLSKGYPEIDVDEARDDGDTGDNPVRGATAIGDYVFKNPDGKYEFGNALDFKPMGSEYGDQGEDAGGTASGLGGTKWVGDGQAWGDGAFNYMMAYNDPRSPHNRQEFDARVETIKFRKQRGEAAAFGMSSDYDFTLEDLKIFARMSPREVSRTFGSGGEAIHPMLKLADSLDQDSVDAFNAIGGGGGGETESLELEEVRSFIRLSLLSQRNQGRR